MLSYSASEIFRHKYGEIPKLSGNNYQSWRTLLLQVLAAIDGDDIATGDRQPPAGAAQLRDYNKLKKQVAAIIYSSISPIVHPHVMACRTDPAEMLRKLASQYNTTLNLASASRRKQLFN
jgi:hypothetical protein